MQDIKKYALIYVLIGIGIVASYYFVRQDMIFLNAYTYIINSPFKFNMVILLGLWGMLHHKIIPVKNKYLDIVVLFLGFVVIVLALRFLGGDGMKTIFG